MTKNLDSQSNVTRFKELLLELHRGAEPSSMFDEFHELISAASADEYEEIKQQMILEGVPKKRAKRWRRNHSTHEQSVSPN